MLCFTIGLYLSRDGTAIIRDRGVQKMSEKRISRRQFLHDSVVTAAGVAVAMGVGGTGAANAADKPTAGQAKKNRILNYNDKMEYRRLGKTGLMVSAISLGGHWKRLISGNGWDRGTSEVDLLDKNRYDIISKCIDAGINLVDACSGGEIMTYAKALRNRRDKMYFSYSWYERETRFPEWCSADKLRKGLEDGLKESGLDYVDIWRISAGMSGENTEDDIKVMIEVFQKMHDQGKARFLGVSSHSRDWLKNVVEEHPEFSVILTPYTAASKEKPVDSLFDAVRKHDVGVLGIKPFSSGSLFKEGAGAEGKISTLDDELARLALRYILCNDAITAPLPGLINVHQVENAVLAIKERRELDLKESAHLEKSAKEMLADLPSDYHWLREWEWV
jgi:aryl-alcohol dehydrogenase-like predicted oxidoreductase